MSTPEATIEKYPPAWIFVPGLAASVGLLFPNFLALNSAFAFKSEMAGLGLAGLCLGGLVASLRNWRASRMLAGVVLTFYWVVIGAISFLILLNPVFVLLYYGIFIFPVFLIVWLCTVRARRRLGSRWTTGSASVGFVCGLMAVLVFFLGAQARRQHHGRISENPRYDAYTIE
jgi:hypothetical protein